MRAFVGAVGRISEAERSESMVGDSRTLGGRPRLRFSTGESFSLLSVLLLGESLWGEGASGTFLSGLLPCSWISGTFFSSALLGRLISEAGSGRC